MAAVTLNIAERNLWSRIIAVEPILLSLRAEARACNPNDWSEYERLKKLIDTRVGFHAQTEDPELRTSEARDVAHKAILGGVF